MRLGILFLINLLGCKIKEKSWDYLRIAFKQASGTIRFGRLKYGKYLKKNLATLPHHV